MRVRSKTLAGLLVIIGAVVPLALAPATEVRAAGDGLTFANTTTYAIDATSGVVHVLADMTLTNTVGNTRKGNTIIEHYFTGFSLPVPVSAVNQSATQNGRLVRLSVRALPDNTAYEVFDVKFASNLFHGQTAHVLVSYDITGQPPRSKDPSRVNAAYAAFDAYGIGDQGRVTVRVVVPDGFVTDVFGDTAVVTHENGNTVYTATNIPNPDSFDIFVSTRNDNGLTSNKVTTDKGDTFNVRSWPGDTAWQQFVTTQIDDGVNQLATLIGQDWPISSSVEVREAYTPYLYGYAGWFSATKDQIEIGEDLDQEVVLHELSHAWFNEDWFDSRWINEGLAQEYSNRAVGALNGSPSSPKDIRSADPGQVKLNDWGDPKLVTGADDVETYGYNASYSVIDQIVDEVGVDKMRDVFAAVAAHTNPYAPDDKTDTLSGAVDWRRFLDLLVEVGGSAKAEKLFRTYVLASSSTFRLDDRAAARTVYDALAKHGGDWSVPKVVRDEMASWDFGIATTTMKAAESVLALRDTLDGASKEAGVTTPATFLADYEKSTGSYDDVTKVMNAQLTSTKHVIDAMRIEAAHHGTFVRIGLMGTHLTRDLDAAKTALGKGDTKTADADAQHVVDTIAKAGDLGKQRAGIVGGSVLLFLLVILVVLLLLRRRRRRRRAEAAALAEAEAAALAEANGEAPADSETPADGEALPTDGAPHEPSDPTVPTEAVVDAAPPLTEPLPAPAVEPPHEASSDNPS